MPSAPSPEAALAVITSIASSYAWSTGRSIWACKVCFPIALDCRDPRVTRVTLVEPDVYKPHNVHRHVFPPSAVGRGKAELAAGWVRERRPDVAVEALAVDLTDPAADRPIAIQPLGTIDRSLAGNAFDPSDRDGAGGSGIARVRIDFGDGTVVTAKYASHTYGGGGHHTIRVSATDKAGNAVAVTRKITV